MRKDGDCGYHISTVARLPSRARVQRSIASAARSGSDSKPLTQTPSCEAMVRGAPPLPAPTSSRLAAADRPSGRASRITSSGPPGMRKPSPQICSQTSMRIGDHGPSGAAGMSASCESTASPGNGGPVPGADGAPPNQLRTLSRSIFATSTPCSLSGKD